MKDTFIQDIIKNMCSKYEYSILELEEIPELSIRWAIMNKDNLHRDILVFLKNQEALDESINSRLYNAFSSISMGVEYRLIKVIVLENNAHSYMQQYVDMCRNISNPGEFIIFDKVKMHVTMSSENVRNVSDEIISSMVIKQEKSLWNIRKSPTTYILVAINILIFLISAVLSKNIFTIDDGVLVTLGAKVNSLILNGEYYRLVTCMFLHGGLLHIALNMYALMNIGTLIEDLYGWKKYLTIYFISGIVASYSSFYFSTFNSIGASGAIFGLMGAILVFCLKNKDKVNKNFMKNIISVIITNLIIGVTIPNIDNFAHIGGLIGGIISTYVISYMD